MRNYTRLFVVIFDDDEGHGQRQRIGGRTPPRSSSAQRRGLTALCNYIQRPAGPALDFSSRRASNRFEPGTSPTFIRNVRIWTGENGGNEVIDGDVLVDKGMIRSVGRIPMSLLDDIQKEWNGTLNSIDAGGAWLTPGLVDLHSHIGVGSAPSLRGASDTNSRKAPILPWLRSIDGLNTHDDSYALAMAGGVTTAQVLPGSANNIGGQSFVIKLRPTTERSPTSMLIEPPSSLNGSHRPDFDYNTSPAWRHMKHACGENPSRVYSQTRMDSVWQFRHAYDEARKVKEAQDSFCESVRQGRWDELTDAASIDEIKPFPESLEWEALVDVLRGKVKLSVHCYEAVDLDAIVRLSNEFKFPVASFHHAGETYLVPDLLKKTWGGAPSIALFASNFRKKREAFRGSEFAPAVLAENGIPVVMKSDHPVINSRYLLNEAALAHYHGLPAALALASVTTTPAAAAGLGHRVGKVVAGYDADLVIWDSHPLSLASTPVQVFIDGIPQLPGNFTSVKPPSFQRPPRVPDFTEERKEAVEWTGLPPLVPKDSVDSRGGEVLFTGVKEIIAPIGGRSTSEESNLTFSVLVRAGQIVCISNFGDESQCTVSRTSMKDNTRVVDLEGGVLAPGLTSFGAPLGLVEIRLEPSTNDGSVLDNLSEAGSALTSLVEGGAVRAVDGLQFAGRNTLLAYRAGVTRAISAPVGPGPLLGLSTTFRTSALNGAEENAVIEEETALHVVVEKGMRESVSTIIGWLRSALAKGKGVWKKVVSGELTLVVHVDSADIMATLLHLKSEVESHSGSTSQMTFAGATEAHLLASEIAEAGVSVILSPSRPFPGSWDQRRILPGPPLSNSSAASVLLDHGVNVAIGVVDEFAARNTRFDAAWAALESHGKIDRRTALALVTTNLEKALGVGAGSKSHKGYRQDFVAYKGGDMFNLESKVVGVVSAERGVVDLF
ncbi:hypothetical protein SCHPADRAFT_917689 [Schizopora paradoxa]|uniref:Amidohydrolase-related domain-containing protein n=1 Tax=Schizopora paradoxa TaxID=27342 RepID=A0A0H2R8A8_9AGAM|nr:hypothetical protein SCHPADRAFT_917689 [Schizopora paradoxa]